MEGLTKEEYLKSRLEQMKEMDENELRDRINRGQRAAAMLNTDYWIELKTYILGKIEEFKAKKIEYSIADKYLTPDGARNEISMIQYEAQMAGLQDMLDHVSFHFEDGKVATAALKLKNTKQVVK